MRYFIYKDKNGAFLGGLTKETLPSKKGYEEVTASEYRRILILNGISLEATEEVIEEPIAEEVIEEPTTGETEEVNE